VVGGAEVDGGTLFVATREGALVAVEAETGGPRWRFETGERNLASPVADGGLVYLATEATPASDPASGSATVHLFAIDARTGNEQWRADLESPLGGPVAVSAGLVLLPAGDVVALDALTGEERWRRVVGEGAEALTADDTTVVARSPGALVGLDPATGAERWTVATTGATSVTPVISAGTLVVGDGDGAVVGRDPDDGAESWRLAGVAVVQPPVAAGQVVVLATTDGVVALDSGSGEQRWQAGLDGADQDDGVRVATDGAAVAATSAGRLTLFDALTGEVLGQADLAGEARATPAVAGGQAYVAEGQTVAAFDRPAG
jgi:outer membrane protein assembly factor BamB